MRSTKKLTLSAILTALGVVFMTLGALIPTLDLTVCALSSLVVALVYIEIGSPYTYLVWLATTLLSGLFFPGSILWLEYLLVFGIFPILKAYIEKAPKGLWLILKLLFCNGAFFLMIKLYELIFKLPFFDEGESFFGLTGGILIPIIAVLVNIMFIAYDMFITVMVRVYLAKYRQKFKHLLK
ncbi:MAG: hypothetical protein IIX96_04385 [Clostridia bacterium]|nr:hypothetical protein [Clostridia bacterium]